MWCLEVDAPSFCQIECKKGCLYRLLWHWSKISDSSPPFLTSKYKNHFKYNLYQISLNFCQWNCFKTLLNVFKMSHTLFSSQPYFNYRVLHVFRINTPISRVGFLLYSFHITSSYSPRWALVVLFVRVTNTIC